MKTPTWEECGIPKVVVDQLKSMKPGFTFDTLVYQLVFHNHKRVFLSYSCDDCAHIHMPTRITDEVSQCPACFNKRVRCIQSLKFNTKNKVPMYSRKGLYVNSIVQNMNENFALYFKQHPDRNVDWEWHDGMFHVAFAGGETASDILPRIAVARAAILTPYLWDTRFDWKDYTFVDKVDQHFIVGLLGHLQPPRRD